MLLVVLDAGEIEPVEVEVEAVLPGGLFERAHAFGATSLPMPSPV